MKPFWIYPYVSAFFYSVLYRWVLSILLYIAVEISIHILTSINSPLEEYMTYLSILPLIGIWVLHFWAIVYTVVLSILINEFWRIFVCFYVGYVAEVKLLGHRKYVCLAFVNIANFPECLCKFAPSCTAM